MMGLAVVIGALYVALFVRPRLRGPSRKRGKERRQADVRPSKTGSAQDVLGFEDIVDDIIILPGKRYRLVLEVMGTVNFPLRSDEEQDMVEASFSTFLMTLAAMNTPVQMYIQSRKLDLQEQIDAIEAQKAGLPDPIRAYADQHAAYLRRWMDYAPYINKRYIVLPFDAPQGYAFDKAKRELLRRKEALERQMARYLTCRTLVTDEIVDLFYTLLNKDKTTSQRSSDAFEKGFFDLWVKGVPMSEARAAVRKEAGADEAGIAG
jgi:hypothetical protein